MTDKELNDRIAAIQDEYAGEEAEAAAVEAAVAAASDQTTMSVRVPADLAAQLKRLATEKHISTSSLVRQILMVALRSATDHSPDDADEPLTAEQQKAVEAIARRVALEIKAG